MHIHAKKNSQRTGEMVALAGCTIVNAL